ncbi:MAG: hypothetical protein ACYDBJ_04135 [Aggregatilineales bacterium]
MSDFPLAHNPVISHYVSYQDSKTCLGLDSYRMQSAHAIGKHRCLVFVGYWFLHLDCLALSLNDRRPEDRGEDHV